MIDQLLKNFTRLAFSYSNLIEIADVTKSSDQIHQRKTAFQSQSAVTVRTANEVLNQDRFTVEGGRQKQPPVIELPALAQTRRTSHRTNFREHVVPIGFRVAPLEVHARS